MRTSQSDGAASERPLNEPTYLRTKRAIVADLIAGHFKPGDHLTIEQLTSRYRISHMPIREALRQLEGEGILLSLAHRGFRIEAISPAYIRNIYDIRVGIESMLARRATENRTEADIREVGDLHRLYQEQVVGPEPNKAIETNIQFHNRLYQGAGNPEAEQLLEGRTRVVRTVAQTLDLTIPQDRTVIVAEHAAIIAAFGAGDAEACGQAVFDHVTRARDRLMKRLTIFEDQKSRNAG